MTTTKAQVTEALCEGDTLADLDCFYNAGEPRHSLYDDRGELIHCSGEELPTREYDDGWGGADGEPVICFSKNYVYFRYAYDGNEHIVSVPRNPEAVTRGVLIGD